ncbi:NEL-type E3 ubiquitin ligase domain-containing protein [Pseudomonas saxonica]|uniref:NEL-type E3 ubiquitin ligase domain-containing protein n=1 Tax=Pseudomonas saxonica TaxID=2600598 RepID=UPI002D795AF2|nr:NEL-type E3 ubiquitin ligase domain-containing protein [Pseudomonas saxonica]WRQ76489.1 NEL-type E3 ubiquitin ligase domain-containing protein [Pseudomonas saxonica]
MLCLIGETAFCRGLIDEVEIYLKYTSELKNRLDLPWQIDHMVFREDDVTPEMIENAAIHVRALEEGTGLRDQLLELPMWTEYLERANPEAFDAIKNKIDALSDLIQAQEELAEKGATLSEVQKEVLRKDIQQAADTAAIKVVPGQVLSDEAYYAQLEVFNQEKTALLQSLTNEELNIEADADEPKTGRADS